MTPRPSRRWTRPWASSSQAEAIPRSTTTVPAPIDGVAVELRARAPISYVAIVESGLPNSCARFGDYDIRREANAFTITVTNVVPTDQGRMCLQVYGMVKTVITLPGPFEEGVAYEIDVNGRRQGFVAGQEAAGAGEYKSVPVPIEEVSVAVLESFPVQYRLIVKSGVGNSCVSFDAYTLQRDGDHGGVTVVNKEPVEPMVCAQVYPAVDTVIKLGTGPSPGLRPPFPPTGRGDQACVQGDNGCRQ
ncbi:MAG: hypothetical protein HY678_12375 [Chloroflexi bacterium]|nr:hypothetical protein [Chloroflexota bacterium]